MTTNRRIHKPHLHRSERWLTRQYQVLHKTPEEIALAAGVEPMTIYRYLNKFGLLRK